MSVSRSIEIHILGRAYKVACTREEEPALIAAADYLDEKMRGIRDSGKVIGATRARVVHCCTLLDAALEEQDKLF